LDLLGKMLGMGASEAVRTVFMEYTTDGYYLVC
jgi:hypothetical protein